MMTKEEAVGRISAAIVGLDNDDVEFVARVLYQAIDRANVHKNIASKRGGAAGVRA